jgi:hypothetical protein
MQMFPKYVIGVGGSAECVFGRQVLSTYLCFMLKGSGSIPLCWWQYMGKNIEGTVYTTVWVIILSKTTIVSTVYGPHQVVIKKYLKTKIYIIQSYRYTLQDPVWFTLKYNIHRYVYNWYKIVVKVCSRWSMNMLDIQGPAEIPDDF